MSALAAVQAALVVALDGIAPVYDGAPPRAAFPYIMISDSPVTDWSTKTERGREIRLALTIWDDGEIAENLRMLMIAVEAAMDGYPRDLPGWRVASLKPRFWIKIYQHTIRHAELVSASISQQALPSLVER